jgi:hypothetical protein
MRLMSAEEALLLDAHQLIMFLVQTMYLENIVSPIHPFKTSTIRFMLDQ